MTHLPDDNLCERCLRCCYRMVVIDDRVYRTPFPCEFLDVDGRRCEIYADRHKINPNCLSIPLAIRHNALPDDCPYTLNNAPDYVGQVPLPDDYCTDDALRALGQELGVDAKTIESIIVAIAIEKTECDEPNI